MGRIFEMLSGSIVTSEGNNNQGQIFDKEESDQTRVLHTLFDKTNNVLRAAPKINNSAQGMQT